MARPSGGMSLAVAAVAAAVVLLAVTTGHGVGAQGSDSSTASKNSTTVSTTTTRSTTTTTTKTPCLVNEEALARGFPAVHNCTAIQEGDTCVARCDEAKEFTGQPVTVRCEAGGVTSPPMPRLECIRRRHYIQTTPDGIVITAYQGDVIARVGEETVGIVGLSEDVDDIDARVSTLEAHSLNQRITSLEDDARHLSREVTAVNTTQAALLDAAMSTLRVEVQAAQDQGGEDRDELRQSLQSRIADVQSEALERSQTTADNANSAISSAAASIETALETQDEGFSNALSSALESVGSIEMRTDEQDTSLAAHESVIAAVGTGLDAATARIDTAEDGIDTLQGLVGANDGPGLSQSNPGRTCSHILLGQNGHNAHGDGEYWIDPNGGSADDAFKVQCDMSNGGWTVIAPTTSISLGDHNTKSGDGRNWYTDPVYDGERFSYDIADSQLSALIRLSTSAKQRSTFHCKGVLIWRATSGTYSPTHSARFRSFSSFDEWSGPPGSDAFSPDVPTDGCKGNQNSVTEQTVFVFETDTPELLPIVDISVNDDGHTGEEWGLEYGAVSFRYVPRDGTSKARAGKSCSHIRRDFPSSPNGMYFIDPNRHKNDDAFEVYCDMESGGWTTIDVATDIPKAQHRTSGDARVWMSTENKAIAWKISDSQLSALQDISSQASNQLIFHCRGVIAWRYDRTTSRDRIGGAALWFRTATSSGEDVVYWSDPITNSPSPYNPSPRILSDDCWNNDHTWRKTEFWFGTRNARALPVLDIAVHDFGNDGEQFGTEFKPVMFFTDFSVPSLGSTPGNPGRTCSQIYAAYGGFASDGAYWLDPNGGATDDAVLLECDMTNGGWTAVQPKRHIEVKHWFNTGDSPQWFSTLPNAYVIPYNIDNPQLEALQDLSIEAKQHILFQCDGVLAWFEETSTGSYALQFRGGVARTHTWKSSSPLYLRPQVKFELDGCRHNSFAASAPFEFETGFPEGLPVDDIRVRDAGDSSELFGASIGTAWFR